MLIVSVLTHPPYQSSAPCLAAALLIIMLDAVCSNHHKVFLRCCDHIITRFSLYKTSNHTLKTLGNHVPLHRYPLVVNTSFKSQGSWLQVTETLLKLVKAKKKEKRIFLGDQIIQERWGVMFGQLDYIQGLQCRKNTHILQPHLLSV